MESFFSSVKLSLSGRESLIKESILNHFSENAKEIQFEFSENGEENLGLSDCTNSLCTTIEAIFLHGLKDSFLRQTINIIAGEEVDRRPEPNFWPNLLIISHRQTIEQIESLSQITSDIGYCRAWIRQSLNEGILSSYLQTIRKNSSALNPYYKKYAFLKDTEKMEVAEKIMEGIEICIIFNLPINSSLLNEWTYHPLQMAGIYSPPMKSCPIASGIDVASSLSNTEHIPTPKPVQGNECFASEISNSPFRKCSIPEMVEDLVAQEENFDLLLEKVDKMTAVEEADENKLEQPEEATEYSTEQKPQMGNSIISRMGWSSSIEDDENTNEKPNLKIHISRSNSMTTSISSVRSPLDRKSYGTLLAAYQNRESYQRPIDINDVWERFENTLEVTTVRSSTKSKTPEVEIFEEDLGFEVIQPGMDDKFSFQELQEMVKQTCKLAREKGLDSQGYTCGCSHSFAIGSSTVHVCSFSGQYFCDSCMSPEQFIIPAKVIYNWDYKKYPVSLKAASFLTDFQFQPFIDLKLLNPDIYMAVSDMAHLQSLRIQLNFIRAYLFTCCESIIEKFQKKLWTKSYLYEHIHIYSIADLTLIPKGILHQLLQKTVAFGQEHIMDCPLCCQKGFICEICNSFKVLYPFDIETTFRCELCSAVFHAHCLDASQPCPKCERKRKREDLPLLDAVHAMNDYSAHI